MSDDILKNLSNGFKPVIIEYRNENISQIHFPGQGNYKKVIKKIRKLSRDLKLEFHEAAKEINCEVGACQML